MVKKIGRRSWFSIDAHYRLYIALLVAAGVFFFTHKHLSTPGLVLLIWSSFAFCVIVLDWLLILNSHPREVRKIARLGDSNRGIIFLIVVGAAMASLGAVIFMLKSSTQLSDTQVTRHVMVSMAAVIVSWWLVHTIFCMRYAHLYYDTGTDSGKSKPLGGLQFPGDAEPDYLDFVYFSFVLGTTFQVSDVEISSRIIRRLALMHGLIAFAFNTAILALGINIISSLISH